jgi:hypothetical protein
LLEKSRAYEKSSARIHKLNARTKSRARETGGHPLAVSGKNDFRNSFATKAPELFNSYPPITPFLLNKSAVLKETYGNSTRRSQQRNNAEETRCIDDSFTNARRKSF